PFNPSAPLGIKAFQSTSNQKIQPTNPRTPGTHWHPISPDYHQLSPKHYEQRSQTHHRRLSAANGGKINFKKMSPPIPTFHPSTPPSPLISKHVQACQRLSRIKEAQAPG